MSTNPFDLVGQVFSDPSDLTSFLRAYVAGTGANVTVSITNGTTYDPTASSIEITGATATSLTLTLTHPGSDPVEIGTFPIVGYNASGILLANGDDYLLLSQTPLSPPPLTQSFSSGGTYVIPCFGPGTMITTPAGLVAVEDLRPGEEVCLAAGGTATVRWVGHRRLEALAGADDQPIRIAAGSLGVGLPARDLYLSPEHGVFLDGVLVPARCLTGLPGIAQQDRDSFTYYHVQLDRHAVLLAEGAAVESLLDLEAREAFDNADTAPHEPTVLAPFAPRVTQGGWLEVIRARLAAHAETV